MYPTTPEGSSVPFRISHELGPRACVVRLAGDLDMAVVPELRAGLDADLGSGCTNVVLDLSDVVYALIDPRVRLESRPEGAER